MGELSFSYAQSFEKSGQLGKTNWDAVIRVYDQVGNVIGIPAYRDASRVADSKLHKSG
jgi:hypothetical protein